MTYYDEPNSPSNNGGGSTYVASRGYDGGGRPFVPHTFNLKPSLLGGTPRIYLTPLAYNAMQYIVAESPQEVSWLGTVERRGDDFVIIEVFVLEQTVHSTQTRLEPDDVAQFISGLLDQEDGDEKANKILFWGHSHVRMSVTPSGSYGHGDYGDLATMFRFGDSAPYMIMGIANKKGELRFELFLYDQGIRFEDVPWSLVTSPDDDLRERIKEELALKVKIATPPAPPRRRRRTRIKVTAPGEEIDTEGDEDGSEEKADAEEGDSEQDDEGALDRNYALNTHSTTGRTARDLYSDRHRTRTNERGGPDDRSGSDYYASGR